MFYTTKITEDINVSSETGLLKKVLIHKPNEGIEKVTPERAVDLLYEDIVFLPKMQEEHKLFTDCLSYFLGQENVVDFENLLIDVLDIDEAKFKLIDIICTLEKCDRRVQKILWETDSRSLAKTFITGISYYKKQLQLFLPLPNLIFTRDLGTVINHSILVGQSKTKARSRESILAYYVFNYHPLFRSLRLKNRILGVSSSDTELMYNNSNELGSFSVEGGDVMLLSKGHLLIGVSERTTEAGVKKVLNQMFENSIVEEISIVFLPKTRLYMHLDTIFTMVNENESVAFEPLVMKPGKMKVKHFMKGGTQGSVFESLKALLEERYTNWKLIACGEGKAPFAEREQWTDACNLFAIKDGVAFTYDRNIKTNKALKDSGYNIITASDFLVKTQTGAYKNSDSVKNTIITLSSSELSRARGGPHCMTMPLARG